MLTYNFAILSAKSENDRVWTPGGRGGGAHPGAPDPWIRQWYLLNLRIKPNFHWRNCQNKVNSEKDVLTWYKKYFSFQEIQTVV